ncbi:MULTISPECIES: 3-hydroxyacyl-CoA dehydrogenase family protein [unclassified Arthrobacter]|uniref:3-hydroxyacyl-CoA dehydrogenase family protein n=1 Tax=unclassified Arthrobacter TaxID=235627 RepID=UPI001E2A02E6|nr:MULTISPECIES: 3-hydroxyacyl-CoA dehydrogenase family protein [unclassified Arthrobacter]MCC9146713.1 3-hydroxyacyl-CoA dehydrogenase family protein [Arthrobacter sp. zg-Y919]MDK1277944.1 3-hydroxyacyl-CoA dehydrogenase family protein [Arthrobacter sp. zg.Y919]WIB03462.1 3-hydroxyacyl-CoA dehydrogenase family protein [Arthrobacter sp. zg-Y919]
MNPQPNIDAIRRILVVGSGAMGTQIGALFALAGYDATTSDLDASALDRSREEVRRRLGRLAEKGRRSSEEVESALARMSYTTDSFAAAREADFILEAAVERIDIKRKLFADLDAAAPDHAILATNSSTIPSSVLMDATTRPDRVCNMHFFNPALVMACVEVVRNPETSDATVDTTVALAEKLGKQPVRINREIPGFVANRLLRALRAEALELEAAGIASFEDIDVAARTALGHPMGPFELMDLVGIDVAYLVRAAEHEQTGNPADLPHPSLKKMYEQGHYGRKTGRGWYDYEAQP